jgi:hypothetical protein
MLASTRQTRMESPSHPLMACIKHNPALTTNQKNHAAHLWTTRERRYVSTRSPRQRYQKAPAPHVYAANAREQPYRQATWASVQDSNPGTQGIPRHHCESAGTCTVPQDTSGRVHDPQEKYAETIISGTLVELAGLTYHQWNDRVSPSRLNRAWPARYRHWGPRHDY